MEYQVAKHWHILAANNDNIADTVSNQIPLVTLPVVVVPAAEFSMTSFHLQTAQHQYSFKDHISINSI